MQKCIDLNAERNLTNKAIFDDQYLYKNVYVYEFVNKVYTIYKKKTLYSYWDESEIGRLPLEKKTDVVKMVLNYLWLTVKI